MKKRRLQKMNSTTATAEITTLYVVAEKAVRRKIPEELSSSNVAGNGFSPLIYFLSAK